MNESETRAEYIDPKLRASGMSQGDLATVLSVDRAYISNIENGRMNPTLSTLEKFMERWEFQAMNF